MPYIDKYTRADLDGDIEALADSIACRAECNRAGLLNYAISRLLSKAYELDTEPRYEKINSAVGVTECVKLELYRRLAAPYEDKAIDKNGDIEEYKEKNE